MRKSLFAMLAVLMTVALLSACGSKSEEPAASPSASPVAAQPEAAPALDIDKLTSDYKAIVEMAKGKQDPKKIQDAYKANFQSYAQALDKGIAEDAPKIDENIAFVIDHAVTGEMNADQLEEAVEKGLNWYFYFQIRDLVNKQVKDAMKSGDAALASARFEQAVQAYTAVLEPFVEKRDAKFGTAMKDTLAGAVIPQLREDVKAANVPDYDVHRQMLDKTLIKAFTLATWNYGEKMPTVEKAEVPKEMTEGYFLFLPVYTYLRGGSPADADAVKDAFASGDAARIVPEKIKSSLIAANSGKVKEYLEKSQQELQEGKKDEARVHAMEGAMFVSAQEVFLGGDFAAANAASEAYVKAIDEGKADEAKKQADAILALLAKL